MIPKRIFFYWGNPQMSWMRYLTLETFCKLNPDWFITLYVSRQRYTKKTWKTVEVQDFTAFVGEDWMPKVYDLPIDIQRWDIPVPKKDMLCASHLSNFVKWWELGYRGGIYADMDILWVRPFEDFYKRMCRHDTALAITKYASIGLLAAKPDNAFFKAVYKAAIENWTPARYQCAGVEALYSLLYGEGIKDPATGITDWTQLARQDIYNDIAMRWSDLSLYNIPMQIVYPFKCREEELIFSGLKLSDLPVDTVGLHWYAGNKIAQRLNNTLSPDNPGPFKDLLT